MPGETSSEELKKRFLVYFERAVLCRYRASPDLFVVKEDDMGGEVSVAPASDDQTLGPNRPIHFRVRFGFRRLHDGRVALAAYAPDLEKLPNSEQGVWAGDYISSPTFLPNDPAFDRWADRYIVGLWTSNEGPLRRLEEEIDLLDALCKHALGERLFRFHRNPALNYPIAENTVALEFAHLELYRLVVEGLRSKALDKVARKSGIALTDSSKTLNSIKELLPSELLANVHEPLRKSREQRNKIHGVRSVGAEWTTAFDTFHSDLEEVVEALSQLKSFIQLKTGASAKACLQREQAMESSFPKFNGTTLPAIKISNLNELVGKTIERVEWGEVVPHPDAHQQEAIVIHFTDGSASCFRVGSNAGNLEDDFEGLKCDMFSTDLWVTNAPSPYDESV